MNISLMRNTSEVNKIYKNVTTILSADGDLRSETDVISPVAVFSSIDDTFAGINYAYIPTFNRYYFVEDITVLAPGLVQISMGVDVLMSNADDIMKQYAVIERQQYDFNMELRDPHIPTRNATAIQYTKFPNSFTNYQIVIPIMGN